MSNEIALEKYFKKTLKEKWALGQFNIARLEDIKVIVKTAQKMKSPVIVGVSERTSRPLGLKNIVKTAGCSFLHLDHAKTISYIKEAAREGFSSVHFDGSELSFNQNIKEIKKIKNYAKQFGVLVEGEFDAIGGKMTEPFLAKKFVMNTGADALAVNIGTWHGKGRKTGIDFKRLAKIHKALKDTPLVLHGGSGVPALHIKKAIKLGIVKININTELRLAKTIRARQKIIEDKIKIFGSKNKWLK